MKKHRFSVEKAVFLLYPENPRFYRGFKKAYSYE